MKWFRSHIKQGSRLALFALAIQFALSFGHFHAVAAPAAAATLTQAAASFDNSDLAAASVVEAAAIKSQQQQPASDHKSNDAIDGCAICAVMALAQAALFTTAPVLLLPEAADFLYRVTDAEFVHLNAARVAFQPRAPPLS
jgi:hypothetical protein